MEITVTVNRTKSENKIKEIFTWNPKTKYANDSSRRLYYLLRMTVAFMSYHNFLKLLDIIYLDDSIIYEYEYKELKEVKIFENKVIEYNPILGNKDCKRCDKLKYWNGEFYCLNKGKPEKKLNGCIFWYEGLKTQFLEYRRISGSLRKR